MLSLALKYTLRSILHHVANKKLDEGVTEEWRKNKQRDEIF